MDGLERLYFEKEQEDIKAFCRQSGQVLRYQNRDWYLYQGAVYDADMNLFIPEATNGFLDLYEYFEYFPQPQIKHPCRGCVYFKACGEHTRTAPCVGRVTKREQKRSRKD